MTRVEVGPAVPRTRWVVGALTAWPPIYFVLFISVAVVTVVRGNEDGPGLWLFALHLGTMVLMLGLLAVYARDIFRNPAVREDRRVMWLVLVIFANVGAMPAYWWNYMRQRER